MRMLLVFGLVVQFLVPPGGIAADLAPASGAANLPVYDLSVRLRPEARRRELDGGLPLPAARVPREDLRLVLNAQMRAFRVQVPARGGCEGDAKLVPLKSAKDETRWGIKPPHVIPAGSP